MNHHDGKANEACRWEVLRKLRERQDQSGITPFGAREPRHIEEILRFGVPLSHHDREVSGVPSSVASDVRSAEDSRDLRRDNVSNCSSSSNRKKASLSELSRSQMPPPPPLPSQSSIEISPGVQVHLRGADETWEAIEHDYYMPTECICCESTIFCIRDADYVLCPDCRVVSRLEDSSSRGIGGVGLGFKYEDLARWQIDRQEKTQRKIQKRRPSRHV
jgi:hypothetical protein